MNGKQDLSLKLIICGDKGVGKTSIRNKFLGEKMIYNYLMSDAIDFGSKKLTVNVNGKDYQVNFQIWNTDMPKAKYMRRSYFLGSSGAIMVFDLTNSESFKNLKDWNQLVREYKRIPMILEGNKMDLENEELDELNKKLVKDYLNDLNKAINDENLNVDYLKTNALTGENINIIFESIFKLMVP